MTASFLDAQVSQLPTSYIEKRLLQATGNKTAIQPFLHPVQNAIQLSKSIALTYGQNYREAV
jgi:hypothetical protein